MEKIEISNLLDPDSQTTAKKNNLIETVQWNDITAAVQVSMPLSNQIVASM